jgi:hypothetical protein
MPAASPDGLRDDAAALDLGRRADRLRPVRLLVQPGARAFGKLLPPKNWRAFAFGAGTAAGSFGQFLFAPFGVR